MPPAPLHPPTLRLHPSASRQLWPSSPPSHPIQEVQHAFPLLDGWPKSSWASLRVGLHSLDSPRGLVIELNGHVIARDVPVRDAVAPAPFAGSAPDAAPDARLIGAGCQLSPAPTWRFAIAAHTGLAVDNHWLGEVELTGDALVRPTEQRLEVSLNGQQYTADGVPFTYDARVFVSGYSPTSGPVAGGTTVRPHSIASLFS